MKKPGYNIWLGFLARQELQLTFKGLDDATQDAFTQFRQPAFHDARLDSARHMADGRHTTVRTNPTDVHK